MSGQGPAQQLHNQRAAVERAENRGRAAQNPETPEQRRRKALINQRRAAQASVYPNNGNGNGSQLGGVMGKLLHNTELTAEGIAGQMAMILIFNLLKALFSTQYHIQRAAFSSAQALGIAYEPRMVNGNLVWPEVYPLDHNGNVNYSADPVRPGTADRVTIRCNGLVPKASLAEAYHIQWTEYHSDMMGMQSLTQQERMLLTNVFDAAKLDHQRENHGPDNASDMATLAAMQGAQNAQRAQQAPRPGGGHR